VLDAKHTVLYSLTKPRIVLTSNKFQLKIEQLRGFSILFDKLMHFLLTLDIDKLNFRLSSVLTIILTSNIRFSNTIEYPGVLCRLRVRGS
jgi:hypothetical protein